MRRSGTDSDNIILRSGTLVGPSLGEGNMIDGAAVVDGESLHPRAEWAGIWSLLGTNGGPSREDELGSRGRGSGNGIYGVSGIGVE